MNRKKQLVALIVTFLLVFRFMPATNILAAEYNFEYDNAIVPAQNAIINVGDTLNYKDTRTMSVYYYDEGGVERRHDSINPNEIYTVLGADAAGLTAPAGTEFANWTATYVYFSAGEVARIDLRANWITVAPTATLASGSTVEAGDTVALNLTTAGSIYYTTDGTNPTMASSLYNSPIVINTGVTIKAIGVVGGYQSSPVATFDYAVGTHTVTYNGNGNTGGTVPIDNNLYAKNSTVTVLSNSGGLTRSGYTFSGWTDGSSTYTANSSYTMGSSNVIFTAIWTEMPKNTVTFNGNGGSTEVIPATISVISGNAISTLPAAPTRPGYTFTSWNTEANGSGTAFTASTLVNADITVYAQWTVMPKYPMIVNNGSTKYDSPQTGDSTSVAGLVILAIICGAGAFYCGRRKKSFE